MSIECQVDGADVVTLQELRWKYARTLRVIQERLNEIDQQLQGLPDDDMVLTNECAPINADT